MTWRDVLDGVDRVCLVTIRFSAQYSAEVDIFAFTHAGASAQVFRNLISKMPSWIAFRPIELPGRGMRMSEGYEWDIREVADDLSNELPGFIEKPSIFFGHSMGALVAFETARLMSPSVLHLVVSGHRAPQVPRGHLRGHDQDDAVFVESLKSWGPNHAAWLENHDLRSLFLPILRADFAAILACEFEQDELECPIFALGSKDDPYLDMQALLAWQEVTAASFAHRVFEGGHFYWLPEDDRKTSVSGDALVSTLVDIAAKYRNT